jgi:ADP-heptose:LPS heptosyltransferase
MSEKKYCVFQVAGGLGKNIAATAVAQVIKRTYPDRELICLVSWPELWAALPFVHRVFPLGNTAYFYEEYVDGKDSLFFLQEPYFTTTHINKTHKLVESWCLSYGLEYQGEQPMLKINIEQKKAIRNFYEPKFEGKPLMLLHTNGGLFQNERPYCWSRDMPIEIAQKVANHFKRSHCVMQITRPSSPQVDGVFVRNEPLSNTELAGLVEMSSKRLLIDSSLQHMAAAFRLPSTVLWNATSSVIFGHSMHDNIQAKEKPKKSLPGSYLFDYQFDANENEFPYEEEDLKDLYNIDQIIDSLEKQTNEIKKGFA